MEKAEVKQEVRQTVRRAAPGIEALARVSYFAKGTVYVLMGLFAGRAALETGHSAGEGDPKARSSGWASSLSGR